MKKNKVLLLSSALLISLSVSAQGLTDAYNYINTDVTGSARYMGLGGAMGALGGDITTLSNNPAGIGVYRSSEVVITGSFGATSANSSSPASSNLADIKHNRFNAACNNLGYVGTFNTGKRDGLVNFNFGFAMNRNGGLKRNYSVNQNNMTGSVSDYMAALTNVGLGSSYSTSDIFIPNDKLQNGDFNYFLKAPWLSVLGYNTGAFNVNGSNVASGLYSDNQNVEVDGMLYVEEKTRQDEYTFNFGGNISNTVYFGLGLGVMDFSFTQESFYDEYFYNNSTKEYMPVDYQLRNSLKATATGLNVKMGLIVKPVQQLRLGVAVHTPTWYKFTEAFYSTIESFENGTDGILVNSPFGENDYKLRTPWKFQFSAALVLKSFGLFTFEYENQDFSTIRYSNDGFNNDFYYENEDIKNGLKSINTFKAGMEIRLSKQTNLRFGYANRTSGYSDAYKDNMAVVFPSGTIPSYTIDRGTQYFSTGLGYRYGSVFFDAAFVWRYNRQDAYIYPDFSDEKRGLDFFTEPNRLTTNSYNAVLTLGYKF